MILFFVTVCFTTIYLGIYSSMSYKVDQQKINHLKVKSESFFSNFSLFLSNEIGPVVSVQGKEMVVSHTDNNIFFFDPIGVAKRKGIDSFFSYQAGRGQFDGTLNSVVLKDSVRFYDKGFELNGDTLTYSFSKDKIDGKGDIRVEFDHKKTGDRLNVTSKRFSGDMLRRKYHFYEEVVGFIKRKRRFEDSLSFETAHLSIDEGASLMKLDKDVVFRQRSVEAKAREGHIFLKNYNKKLKYYSLNDDVRVKEVLKLSNGKTLVRKAFAEQLEGQMKMRQIVLSGFPKVMQSGSILTGNKIVLRESQKVIEIQDANSNFRIGNEH